MRAWPFRSVPELASRLAQRSFREFKRPGEVVSFGRRLAKRSSGSLRRPGEVWGELATLSLRCYPNENEPVSLHPDANSRVPDR